MPYTIASLQPEALLSLLGVIVVLSLIIERALAVPFEHKVIGPRLSQRSLKEPIAVLVSFFACIYWHIDVITVLVDGVGSRPDVWGELLTATVIAGGNKASLKLFHDVLGVRSNAEPKPTTEAATS